jgi:hypothetical protein
MKKRKVKRYEEGGILRDSSGNPVRSGSGEVVRTRFPEGRKYDEQASASMTESSDYTGRRMKSPEVEKTEEAAEMPRRQITDYIRTSTEAGPAEEGPTLAEKKAQREAERKAAQRRAAVRQKAEADRAAKAADQTKAAREMGEGYKKSAYDTEKQRQARMAKEQALETVSPESSLIGGFGLRAMKMLAQGLAGRQAAKEAAQTMGRRMEKDITPRPPQLTNEPLKIGRESLKLGMKKGGAVKKMASGGSVSSASKRADGIAQRGKTKGRIC